MTLDMLDNDEQAWPSVFLGDWTRLVTRWFRPLVGHLEEQQIRQLLDPCPESHRRVVPIGYSVIPEDVAVVPEFLNDLAGRTYLGIQARSRRR